MAYTTINKSSLHFDSKLWDGTGSAQSITGLEFQPDWVWVKNRSRNSYHTLVDAVRGSSNVLASNINNAQNSDAQQVSSFNSDGFSVGTSTNTNASGETLVGWNWKANGQGSSNTDGTINTTYTSANTTSGFSISTYTGTGSAGTIGHGLGVAPAMIIAKRLNAPVENWIVYHQSLGSGTTPQDKYLHLNTTDAEGDSAGMWNDTAPTTSVFSVGSTGVTNGSGGTFVAYCFAEKTGFSKFGSYVGNGNADGSFIYTGFKPAFVIIKDSGRAESWHMFDNRRLGYNGAMADFLANTTALESSSSATLLDLVSNGFKLRGTTDHLNGSGQNFIYMAFAEAPLVGSNNVPATAR